MPARALRLCSSRSHQTAGWRIENNVAEFRKALNAGNLSAVGLDRAEPGLVLYTLKSGERASTIVPGCTTLGCAGTALDSLGDKSAQAGLALVRVDVDPRTKAAAYWTY